MTHKYTIGFVFITLLIDSIGFGIMSAQVPANGQGELQGGVASMSSLTSILSPPLMTGVFAMFTADTAPVYFPGAAFVLAAALSAGSLLMFMWTARSLRS